VRSLRASPPSPAKPREGGENAAHDDDDDDPAIQRRRKLARAKRCSAALSRPASVRAGSPWRRMCQARQHEQHGASILPVRSGRRARFRGQQIEQQAVIPAKLPAKRLAQVETQRVACEFTIGLEVKLHNLAERNASLHRSCVLPILCCRSRRRSPPPVCREQAREGRCRRAPAINEIGGQALRQSAACNSRSGPGLRSPSVPIRRHSGKPGGGPPPSPVGIYCQSEHDALSERFHFPLLSRSSDWQKLRKRPQAGFGVEVR
jgi:hypothetical protein